MPPKPKFTREEIIAAALKIAAEGGIKALTSRELGAALGSSARPIFTVFKNMEEVKTEVHNAAINEFNGYAEKAKGFTPIFKQVGLQMIMFATEQPKLFRLAFMSENDEALSFEALFPSLGETAALCVEVIQKDYALDYEHSIMLFKHCWIYTFGIGVMISTKACLFTPKEISDMLSREFVAMLMLIKSGRADDCTTVPEKK